MDCKYCGDTVGDGAALCPACFDRVKAYVGRAHRVLPLLDDEVARVTKKRPAGGGGGGGSSSVPAPVNLTALQAKDDLSKTLAALAKRARTGDLARDLIRLKSPAPSPDPLYWLTPSLFDEVTLCERLADTPPERVTVGACPTCDRRIRGEWAQTMVKCDLGHASAVVEAYEHLRGLTLDRLPPTLPVPRIPDALTIMGYPVTLKQVEGWVRRGKVEKVGRQVRVIDALEVAELAAMKEKNPR